VLGFSRTCVLSTDNIPRDGVSKSEGEEAWGFQIWSPTQSELRSEFGGGCEVGVPETSASEVPIFKEALRGGVWGIRSRGVA
jgi:hypothetical protein